MSCFKAKLRTLPLLLQAATSIHDVNMQPTFVEGKLPALKRLNLAIMLVVATQKKLSLAGVVINTDAQDTKLRVDTT
jgi:hypothetical protein